MIVAVSADGKTLDSAVSELFGRCPFFLLAEVKKEKITLIKAVENSSAGQRGGAGVSAAQTVVENSAKAVIAKNIGPRARDVFKQFGVPTYKGNGSAKNALAELAAGKLEKI